MNKQWRTDETAQLCSLICSSLFAKEKIGHCQPHWSIEWFFPSSLDLPIDQSFGCLSESRGIFSYDTDQTVLSVF